MDGPKPIIIRTAQTEVARLLNLKKKRKGFKVGAIGEMGENLGGGKRRS